MGDDLQLNGKLRIPTKWIVSVIAAISTALGGSGAAMYKIGKLESEVSVLRQICAVHLKAETTEDSRHSASQK